ncbi:hypothetical protein Leryth_020630 [Lithospermum erythrorhizon]|nr:hypothetical protein Leryth_020630 [Lithospermum erythrorhizon]
MFAPNRRYACSFPRAYSSTIQWISPLQTRPPDRPIEKEDSENYLSRKRKFMSHESAINLIKSEKDPLRALAVFNKVSEQRGFNHNNATYGTILYKLAVCKEFHAIDAILHRMTYEACEFHEGVFINLMKRFSKFSMHDRVLEMFNLIQPIVREKPSLKAISTCLNLLVEANQIDLARTFLLNAQNNLHLKPNTCIFNILVKHHCKSGDVESAFEVFKGMKASEVSYPNLITYSTLMDGLCKCGKLQEAIDLFEQMISMDQILPDVLTYNVLINGFSRGGKVDRARKIMEFMKNNGCNPNIYNYSALMNGFCLEGRLKEAKDIFNEMKGDGLKPDKVVYTTLINCMCRADALDAAFELLEEMKEINCQPDEVTVKIILGGLCRQSRFDEAFRMLERLPRSGFFLSKSSYRIVLNFLNKEGDLDKATLLLILMVERGILPHFATSNEILVRFCEAGRGSDAAMILYGLAGMGFNPESDTWRTLVEVICRERKLLPAFELVDDLIGN